MRIACLFWAILALFSCKQPTAPSGETEAKSLDNFTDVEAETNVCGDDVSADGGALSKAATVLLQRLDAEGRKSSEIRDALASSLSAAPARLIEPFAAANGRIRISSEAVSLCRTTKMSEAERELAQSAKGAKEVVIRACWRMSDDGKSPEVVVAEDVSLVRHSMLRLLAYVYTEYFIARIEDPKAPPPFSSKEWKDAAHGFSEARRELARKLLEDLATKRAPSLPALSRFHDREPLRFANFALAEAVDSYYCSEKARDKFARLFEGAWKVFTNAENPHAPAQVFGVR